MPWIMAALTAAQMMQEQQKEKETRQARSIDQRYSPWTHAAPTQIDYANPWSRAAGAYYGVNQQQQAEQNNAANIELRKAQMEWLRRGGSPQAAAATNGVPASGIPASGMVPSPNYEFSPWQQVIPDNYA